MTRLAQVVAVSALFAVTRARAGDIPLVSELTITNTDFATSYTPGSTAEYSIVVGNAGPDAVVGASVTNPVFTSPQVTDATWTCIGANGGTCAASSGTGDVNDTVDLPKGGTVTYTLVVTLSPAASENLENTATVTPPAGTTDPTPVNNTAKDTDAPASLIYVAPTGEDSGTCGTPEAPCRSIQAAIHLAKAGDTVVVGIGTYAECIALLPGSGLGGVRVESDEHLARGTNAATILDGTGLCDGGSLTAGPVATIYDESSLIGFTVMGGGDSGIRGLGAVTVRDNVITGNETSTNGGGLRLTTGSSLSDSRFKAEIRSNAILLNKSGRDGAGIYVDALASGIPSLVEIKGNTVSGNVAGGGAVGASGAGIAVFTDSVSADDSSRVVITGNTLDGNVAKNALGNTTVGEGGGLFVGTGATFGRGTETVTIGVAGGADSGRNFVRNNVSEGLGGGMSIALRPAASGKHTVDLDANIVTANSARRGGGGVHLFARAIDHPAVTQPTPPDVQIRVTGNSFVGNHAQVTPADLNAAGGGGIFAELHSDRTGAGAVLFEISGNTIERNEGAPHGGGASLLVSADDDPAPDHVIGSSHAVMSFHHNLVAANAAHDATVEGVTGGGVFGRAVARGASSFAQLSQDFLTVAGNQTELGTGGLEWTDERLADSTGGAVGATSFALSNSIITGNNGYGVGGTVRFPATTLSVSYTDAFGSGTADYDPLLGLPAGAGNISVDPALDAVFVPRLCGPTIDAGDPALAVTDESLPNGGRVNMGHLGNTASATRTFPDVNGDKTVDGLDVLGIAVAFMATSPGPRYFTEADVDLNHMVDGDDLAYVSAFYAQSCP